MSNVPAVEPQVSVVLPTRDRIDVLPRALDSVLAQTGVSLECIVVDDGSTDGTKEWLGTCHDPRLVIVETQGAQGPSAARNRGIEVARGRFVAFQDSDDEWLPGKLKAQLDAFEREPAPVLCFTGMLVDVSGRRHPAVADVDGDGFDALLAYAGPITTPGLVVDRRLAGDELHFDELMPAMVEHELILRLARRHPVARVPEPLYVRYLHDGPRVTDPHRQIVGRRRILERFSDELAERPKAAAVHHWRLAAAERAVGDWSAAADDVTRAAALDRKVRFRALAMAARVGRRPLRAAWAAMDRIDAMDRRSG
jgi:glycosyltransferase involved in cell wall biosynthesis